MMRLLFVGEKVRIQPGTDLLDPPFTCARDERLPVTVTKVRAEGERYYVEFEGETAVLEHDELALVRPRLRDTAPALRLLHVIEHRLLPHVENGRSTAWTVGVVYHLCLTVYTQLSAEYGSSFIMQTWLSLLNWATEADRFCGAQNMDEKIKALHMARLSLRSYAALFKL